MANEKKKRIAVVLCGSGYKDGSEIRESVGVLWALSQHSVEVSCFAPNSDQHHVVNCLTGDEVSGEKRNMLVESARIARGQVQALSHLNPDHFDAIILPGGFGAAKNLCTFAFKGSHGTVQLELATVLERFHAAKKPIAAVCIAPAILGLTFRGKGFELTVGAESEASQEIQKMGHQHIVRKANECHVDRTHRVVTSPAYMYDDAPLHEIFVGIQKLVNETVSLA